MRRNDIRFTKSYAMKEIFDSPLDIQLPTNLDMEKVKSSLTKVINQDFDYFKNNFKWAREKRRNGKYHPMFGILKETLDPFITNPHSTNQLILNLQDDSGYIVKLNKPYGKNIFTGENHSHYKINLHGYDYYITKYAEEVIAELGLGNVPHHYIGVDIHDNNLELSETSKGRSFVITPDLTLNNTLGIEDINQRHFQDLDNGAELNLAYGKIYQTIKNIVDGKNHAYRGHIFRHPENERNSSDLEAIKHMFFVQIDRSRNTGKLAIGDKDHIKFMKNSSNY